MGEPYPVSAIHGSGTGDLLDLVIDELPENNIQDEEEKIMMSTSLSFLPHPEYYFREVHQ